MKLGKIESSGKCWFCKEPCDQQWYWHIECKQKFMEEER